MYLDGSLLLNPHEVTASLAAVMNKVALTSGFVHDLPVECWYHDMPIWFIGSVQLNLVMVDGETRVEVHDSKGNTKQFPADIGEMALLGEVIPVVASSSQNAGTVEQEKSPE